MTILVPALRDEEDAYGQSIWAYFNNNRSYEIIERDDGYFDVSSGASTYFAPYEKWLPHEQSAIKFAQGRVIDIGCGAGRHALYLQDHGFDVLGIDVSPLAIQVCKLRGLKKAEIMAIEDLHFEPHRFDTILMLGNNFGLFGGPSRARDFLRQFQAITSPTGRIIAESNDPYQTTNPAHLEYHAFNRARGRSPGQLRIRVRFAKNVTPWFDYLIVSKSEMEQILLGTGWHIQRFIDSGKSTYIAIIENGDI